MASEYRKIMSIQIKNGVCLLCIFALMLLLAACSSLHTTQAEVRSFSVILLLVIGLLLMSVLALIAFLRYKMLHNKQQHQEEMNRMMALKMENVRNRFRLTSCLMCSISLSLIFRRKLMSSRFIS